MDYSIKTCILQYCIDKYSYMQVYTLHIHVALYLTMNIKNIFVSMNDS